MKIKNQTVVPTLIRFDWVMKGLLRQKANYKVLEVFLSVLLRENIKIINIKESETNKINVFYICILYLKKMLHLDERN